MTGANSDDADVQRQCTMLHDELATAFKTLGAASDGGDVSVWQAANTAARLLATAGTPLV